MRPGQQKQRGRGRNNNSSNNGGNNNNFNRKGGNPLTRTYDSSGPDVKIRGTAQHVAEKYAALARDAQSSGDRVMAENYLQHAEHYNRIIAAAQAQMQERFQRDERSDYGNDRDGDEMDGIDGDEIVISQQQSADDNEGQERSERPERAERNDRQERSERPDRPERNDRRERFEQRRNDRQDRPQRQPRPERQEQPVLADGEQPVQVATPRARPQQTVYDASNEPQPVIDGTPVEVAVEVESQAEEGAATARAPRRPRATTARPRRPRRSAGDEAEGADAAQEAPVSDTAAAE